MEFIKLNIQFFGATNEATSNSSSSSGNKSTLYCRFTEADPTEAEKLSNKTKITAYCTYKQGGSFAAYYTPKLKLTWYDDKDNVNGKELGTLSVTSMSSGATKKIEPAAFYVTHKEDGSLNGYLKAEWIWTGGGHACPSTTATTTTTKLTTIPRANTFKSVPDSANVGQGFTVTLDKKISSSSTKVVCTCNGKSQEVTTSSDIATFSLPGATFAGAFGSTESKKTATITATTYNGTTQIGNSVTDTITLYLPQEAYKPVLSISAVDSNTNTKTLTGDTTGRTCVLNASTMTCTVSAAAQNNATLSSVTINGKNVATTTTSYTISNPTTNVFTITASDSRGFSNTATDTLNKVVDYFKPTLTANFKRNTPTDGKVNLTYSGKVFNKSFGAKSNELSFYYEYKLKSASSYTRVALSPTINEDTFSGGLTLNETYDYKQNYSFRLCVKDSLNTVVYAQDVAKGEPVFWWNNDGVNIVGNITTEGITCNNLFDISGVTLNKYLSSVDGATGSSSVTHISNYIKIKANTRYIISYDYGTLANESDRSIVYYDDSKSYLKGVTYVPKSKIIQLYSEQDGYVRFTYDINITNIQVKQEATNEIYSTNELIIGTWIDGKPLYQKLINVGTLPNATKKTVNHNIANLKYIVGFEGFAYRDDGLSLPLPFVASSIANMIYLTASRTSIELTTGVDRTTFSGFVILKYIKFD